MESSQFQKEIYEKFKKYMWPEIKLENQCETTNTNFELNPTQEFVSRYIQPTTKNGMLLWHSVGSGKTLSALAIVKNFEKQGSLSPHNPRLLARLACQIFEFGDWQSLFHQ